MEFIFVILGLLYGISPIIAIVMARKARRRVDELERATTLLRQDLHALQSQVLKLQLRPAPIVTPAAAPVTATAPETAPAVVSPQPEPVVAPPETIPAVAPAQPVFEAAAIPVAAPPTVAPPTVAPPIPVFAKPIAASVAETVAGQRAERAVPAATASATSAPDWDLPSRPPRKAGDGLLAKARTWLFTGNLVAKLGLLILFIGVSFLLKYVAAEITLPIELRLAAIALADIALLVWGWRIRLSRPAISLPVQGAALAILMMVVFGSFRLYHLIPAGMAFALLLVLTIFTCLLAVLQNAIWLATFGIVGGFAVPLLASTGGGSHIGLFSYYALLNAGVFAIALKRSWRMLNLLGFAFTFVVGTAWGILKYTPENYLSTQLFLILFFLFYVAIALAYAAREAPKLKHYVDATLVFGTPMLALGLQVGLVKDTPFGLAFSALALGLFYTGLATALWRRGKTFKLLAETFLALGILFGTLAIPFALDGRWTSAAWALEGAGIVWVGLRQHQTRVWAFGLLVQAGAWFSFLGSLTGLDAAAARHDNLWLGFLILAATALFMATTLRGTAAASGQRRWSRLSLVFLGGATIWLLAGSWTEILLRSDGVARMILLSGSAVAIAAVLGVIASRMQWAAAGKFAVAVQACAGLALLIGSDRFKFSPNLFEGPFLSTLILGLALFISAWLFERQARAEPAPRRSRIALALLSWSGICWYILVLGSLTAWIIARFALHVGDNNLVAVYVILLAPSAPAFAWLARRLAWPTLRWFTAPAWLGLVLSSAAILAMLHFPGYRPTALSWCALALVWLASEYLLQLWPRVGWHIGARSLKLLHTIRIGAPWLMIWPVGEQHISAWLLAGDSDAQRLLAQAGWEVSGSWARYLPFWAMMLVAGCLARRCRAGGWPVAPIPAWYRDRLLPLAALWSLCKAADWNLSFNGAMAPLPYLPLLNPLDLTTGFAVLLAIACYRLMPSVATRPLWQGRLPLIAGCAAYAWFNLMLLRTVSNYMGVPYNFDAMLASQFVQAMLSLVWSVSALLVMRRAAQSRARTPWGMGAALLALVVAKLFLIDLSSVGSIGRIVSFVGVGALMLVIGYLAPFPSQPASPADETPS
ncbi:putative membrane protein [Oxalobacteraceae bacterium GrIS 1.11]